MPFPSNKREEGEEADFRLRGQVEELAAQARAGNAQAQMQLGLLIETGYVAAVERADGTVQPNSEAAVTWLLRAAQSGARAALQNKRM